LKTRHLIIDKSRDDDSKEAALAKNLVYRGTLCMSEPSKLGRARSDHGVGSNGLIGRCSKKCSELLDQRRGVAQQPVSGKNVIGRYPDELFQRLQPSSRQQLLRGLDSICNDCTEIGRNGVRHRSSSMDSLIYAVEDQANS
jgi:hypothetical protein